MLAEQEMVFALYTQYGVTIEAIERLTGLPTEDINKMIQDNQWQAMVATNNMAPARLVSECYTECSNIMREARRKQRPLTDAEVNRMAKLVSTANKLDFEQSPGTHMEVLAAFNYYLVQRKPQLAKDITEHELAFVRHLMYKNTNLKPKQKK